MGKFLLFIFVFFIFGFGIMLFLTWSLAKIGDSLLIWTVRANKKRVEDQKVWDNLELSMNEYMKYEKEDYKEDKDGTYRD